MKKYYILLLLMISFQSFIHAQTYTWNGFEEIHDQQSDTIPVVVSGLPSVIDTSFGIAHICMNISHTYDADLVIKLFAPNGDSVTLIQGIGGGGDNFWGTCVGMDGTFFSNASAPYSGIFQPIGNVSALNNGQNPNGIWKIKVSDVANADTGSIHQMSIVFTNNPPIAGSTGTGGGPTGNYICATCVCPGGASSCDLLPDMTASAQEIQLNHQETPGALYISNATPNIGYGPLEIYGIDSCFCGTTPVPCGTTCTGTDELHNTVRQRIYQKVAGTDTLSFYDRTAGQMTYHPSHGHLHVDDFASYTLRTPTSNPDATTWPIIAEGTKQSFCLINLGNCPGNPGLCRDNNGNIITTVPNQNLGFHTGCGLTQGIYPGNYDVYSISLNDPIPLTNVCNGNYYIVSITDPNNNFLESDETNNWVAVPITLTLQNSSPTVAASGPTTFCQGDSVILTASLASNYLWSNGDTTQSIVVKNTGSYSVSSNCGLSIGTSNPVAVTVVPTGSLASIGIALTNGSNPSCPGAHLTFTASTLNVAPNATYTWKVNGLPVGTNSTTYTTTNLVSGAVVTCEVTTSLPCISNTFAVSNAITMNVGTALCYCIPIYGTTANSGCLDGDVIARIQLNTLDNHTGSSCPSGIAGYSDFSLSTNPQHTTTLQAGNSYTCTVTAGQYGEGYKVWIDYNNDGLFSTTEAIGNTTAVVPGSGTLGVKGSSASFLVNISCQASIGPHRMRVRCMYNNNGINIDPCVFQNNFGEVEDYTIFISAPVGCSMPTQQTVTNISSTSATLSWTAGCNETLWQVHVALAGSGNPPAAVSHPNSGNPLNISGLIPNTAYEFWVLADCIAGGGGLSSWKGPFAFTTLPLCATLPGTSFSNPIVIGQVPCLTSPYINTQNNNSSNCFTNNYAGANNQASADIWHQFTLTSAATVNISHCGSGFDTYLHLLNSSGVQVVGNDDNGPLCAGLNASISSALTAGTYYIVSEGYGGNTGAITLTVNRTDSCPVYSQLNIKCFIQGYWDGVSAMKPVLANQGIGSNNSVCDSIQVEIHANSAPFAKLYGAKTVLNTDGTASILFPYLIGNYYLAIKHRNALQTWSANPITFNQPITDYDFSTNQNKAYGSNQLSVAPSTWAFYGGDLNLDDNIDLDDVTIMELAIKSFAFGYVPEDLDGDGNVDLNDIPFLELNVNSFIFSSHP